MGNSCTFEKVTDKLMLAFVVSPIKFLVLSALIVYVVYSNLLSYIYDFDDDFK